MLYRQNYDFIHCIVSGSDQLQGRSPVHRELRQHRIMQQTHCAVLPSDPEITNTHVIRYNGVLYDITRVDTFEGYREDITLYCCRRARQ